MLTIHMFKDGRVQLIDQEQVPHKTRYVSLEDMVEAFRGQAMASPILPEGCTQYWRGHGYEIVVLYRPAHKREMFFYDDTYMMPVPGTVFAFRIDNYDGESPYMAESAVFAVAGRWNGPDTQLCGFPYGNVFDENTICWGGYEFSDITLMQLSGAPDIFLGSPFNDDLNGKYQNPDYEDVGLLEFWEQMSELDTFPVERLNPICLYSELPAFLGALFY